MMQLLAPIIPSLSLTGMEAAPLFWELLKSVREVVTPVPSRVTEKSFAGDYGNVVGSWVAT